MITACGFVTYPDASEPSYGIGRNSDYRLRYKKRHNDLNRPPKVRPKNLILGGRFFNGKIQF